MNNSPFKKTELNTNMNINMNMTNDYSKLFDNILKDHMSMIKDVESKLQLWKNYINCQSIKANSLYTNYVKSGNQLDWNNFLFDIRPFLNDMRVAEKYLHSIRKKVEFTINGKKWSKNREKISKLQNEEELEKELEKLKNLKKGNLNKDKPVPEEPFEDINKIKDNINLNVKVNSLLGRKRLNDASTINRNKNININSTKIEEKKITVPNSQIRPKIYAGNNIPPTPINNLIKEIKNKFPNIEYQVDKAFLKCVKRKISESIKINGHQQFLKVFSYLCEEKEDDDDEIYIKITVFTNGDKFIDYTKKYFSQYICISPNNNVENKKWIIGGSTHMIKELAKEIENIYFSENKFFMFIDVYYFIEDTFIDLSYENKNYTKNIKNEELIDDFKYLRKIYDKKILELLN
jgi:hypothetical protein